MWVIVTQDCIDDQYMQTSCCRLHAAARQAYTACGIYTFGKGKDAHLSLALVVISQASWIKNSLPKVSSLHCHVRVHECVRCALYRTLGSASMCMTIHTLQPVTLCLQLYTAAQQETTETVSPGHIVCAMQCQMRHSYSSGT